LLKMRRVGHLGTLDPMATGVLLVTIGSATKLFDLMQEKIKVYIAEFELGWLTDTLDATGETISRDNVEISRDALERAINLNIGAIDQIPPKYSAKSVSGKRAYELARQNIEFELLPKRVTIHNIELLEYSGSKFKIKISCSSGTYIRAVGRDIASYLGTNATMTSLVRTDVGHFNIVQSVSINNLTIDNICDFIVRVDDLLDIPNLDLSEIDTKRILNGQTLIIDKIDGLYKLNDEMDTIALVKIHNKHGKMSVFLG
ncbi:MAG: tRNA pseudouridine(55) synthase TruB, partial [Clostridia bacterium]|nr:tRNA pseudouridine(55) synthase TruB [Clostridia bacterium]